MSATKFLAGFIVGGAIGAIAGILLAQNQVKKPAPLLQKLQKML